MNVDIGSACPVADNIQNGADKFTEHTENAVSPYADITHTSRMCSVLSFEAVLQKYLRFPS
jgi:hypothetical protein